jgi:hypothetical protein
MRGNWIRLKTPPAGAASREKIGWAQVDLKVELEVKSRQTMSTWERAE